MKKMTKIFFFLLIPFLLFAEKKESFKLPALISIGGGCFEVMRARNRTGEFRIEYKSDINWYTIRPMLGLMANNQGAFYTYGGFGFDWVVANCFVISPNFAAGFYQRGESKKLGFPLEFRSGLELAWQFENYTRIGGQFYHISNASLGSRNPGEESLVFFISIPLQFEETDSLLETHN